MNYGKLWWKRFGLSTVVCGLFNLYFFFFIQNRMLGCLIYLDILFLAVSGCMTGADYWKFAGYQREKKRLMGQEELICRAVPDFENQDVAEHDVRVLEKQLDRLFEENCELQDYVARWCHELKIPLAAGFLMNEKISDRELKMALQEQLEKMKQQINSLLLGCKLQSSLLDIQIRPIQPGECVKTSLRNNRFFLIHNRFEIQVDVEDTIVYTDSSWVVYVLDQLISNAVKYRKRQKGDRGEEGPKLFIWLKKEQAKAKLFVEDRGEGIRDSDIRRIFEKGFTGKNYHNGKYKSTGMGLYMVSKIIERLGHEIHVESEYGEYTRFWITF